MLAAPVATHVKPDGPAEEADDFHELIIALTRESKEFTGIRPSSRAGKLAEKMLELFLDFEKIPAAKAAGVRERIRQLFTHALIELRYGRFMSEPDIQDARRSVEGALREAAEVAKTR